MGVQLRVALGYQLGLVLKEMTELIDSAYMHTMIQYNQYWIPVATSLLYSLFFMLVIVYDLYVCYDHVMF